MTMRPIIISLLLVAMISPLSGAEEFTLTLTGTYTTSGQRIDLGAPGSPHTKARPLYLALTNLRNGQITYTFHTTGPNLRWEIDFGGKVYRFNTSGWGSGGFVSKTLQARHSGVIPTRLLYSQLPDEFREVLDAERVGTKTFIDSKVRVSLTIPISDTAEEKAEITVASEWSSFRVGSIGRPPSRPGQTEDTSRESDAGSNIPPKDDVESAGEPSVKK